MIKSKAYDFITNAITTGMHLHPIPTGRIADHVYVVKVGTVNFLFMKNSIRKLARLENISLACTAHNGYTEQFEAAVCSWKKELTG